MAGDRLVGKIHSNTTEATRKRDRLRKRRVEAVRDSIRAEDISDEDIRGMLYDRMEWKRSDASS